MQARSAMIVWEPATAETHDELPGGRGRVTPGGRHRQPEVRVFDDADKAAHERFSHLPCSLGACVAGWCEGDTMADVFRVFLSVVSDGVPMPDVHREFLNIDEYAAMIGGAEYFGVTPPEQEE